MPFDVTRCYDEATQYPRPAHLDRRARPADVEGARRPDVVSVSLARWTTSRSSFPYRRPPTRTRARRRATRWWWSAPGRSGLALAIDLAQQQVPVVLLDNDDRAVDRLARDLLRQAHAGDLRPARPAASAWSTRACRGASGACSCATRRSTSFDLLPETGHERPAFINLQQYYVEGYLVERALRAAADRPALEARGGRRRRRTRDARHAAGARRPTARYALQADYVVACDGARSSVRAAARPGEPRAARSATAS